MLGGKIMNPYLADILAQPSALRDALKNYSPEILDGLYKRLQNGDFDRIIITGMGSSHNASYPALIQLCNQTVPVQFVNASELLHSLHGMIGTRSLLWMNSQSGQSAELINLLTRLKTQSPACLLASVNILSSPLASSADVCLPIHAGEEATVSTKTYVNMLAVNLLAALQLTGNNIDSAIHEMQAAADSMEAYLNDWESQVKELDSLLGDFKQLFILGRGTSMSVVWTGSLINKEAAKCAFEGMHAADFRHGPLELASPDLSAFIFAGSAQTSNLNRDLASDITTHDGHVIWIDSAIDVNFANHLIPATSELTRPLVEILPMQMLTLVMAKRKGLQAGKFRYLNKVTARE